MDARKANLPSIFGAESPFIPLSKMNPLIVPSSTLAQTIKTSEIGELLIQFIAPDNMDKPVKKIETSGSEWIVLTERGYTFGYNDLVVDPRSFLLLNQIGYPVVFDITHTIRKYGIPSKDPKGGSREFLSVLSRAGVAAGVDGIFIEAHPNPSEALCDAASQYYLDDLTEFVKPLLEIHELVRAQSVH